MSALPSRTHDSDEVCRCHRTNGDHAPAEEVTRRDLSDCLEAARVRLGIQVKLIAHWWDCGHAYVSRVLAGKVKLTDERLAQLAGIPEAKPLYVATLEEACADVGVLTGRRAALLRAVEGIAVLANEDPRLPVRAGRPAKARL